MYSIANEEHAIVPMDCDPEYVKDVAEALGVDVFRSTIAGTNLLGALIALNSYGAVVTSLASQAEVELLSRYVCVATIEDKLNAAGNNILVNDNGAIVNPEVENESMRLIEETLQVEVVRSSIAGRMTVGSSCLATNKGVLCHPETTRAEFDLIKSVMKVPAAIGTLNYGSALVGSCMIANSKGGIVGYRSTPIEIGRVEDALYLY